jgi:hypothetical protein
VAKTRLTAASAFELRLQSRVSNSGTIAMRTVEIPALSKFDTPIDIESALTLPPAGEA